METGMKRAAILDAAKDAVCRDRAATHGDLEDNFSLVAGFWSEYLSRPGCHVELSCADVAAMMLLFKAARIRSNPKHVDSWVDAAGYAACGGEVAT